MSELLLLRRRMLGKKKRLWLYDAGDECADVTGGYAKTGSGSLSLSPQIALCASGGGTQTLCSSLSAVDVSGYARAVFVGYSSLPYFDIAATNQYGFKVGVNDSRSALAYGNAWSAQAAPLTEESEIVADISGVSGAQYIMVGGTGNSGSTQGIWIRQIWLE